MTKAGIPISEFLKEYFNLLAISQTSCFDFEIDCKLDTVGRKLKRAIEDSIGDAIDTLTDKNKKIYEELGVKARSAKNPDQEYEILKRDNMDLAKNMKLEQELFKTKIDFEFQPVVITEAQRKEAYNSVPDDKTQIVEWKGSSLKVDNLHSRFRSLIAEKWIVIEGSEAAKEAETHVVKSMDDVKKITRNRN